MDIRQLQILAERAKADLERKVAESWRNRPRFGETQPTGTFKPTPGVTVSFRKD